MRSARRGVSEGQSEGSRVETRKGDLGGGGKDATSVSHGRAEEGVSGRREKPVCLSSMRKMAPSSGFDKAEATRVPNQAALQPWEDRAQVTWSEGPARSMRLGWGFWKLSKADWLC